MPPPMMRRMRLQCAAAVGAFWRARLAGRLGLIQNLAAGVIGRLPQDDAHLVFHGPAVPRGAQAEQRFQLLVKLPDGEAGHRIVLVLPVS